MENEDSIPPEDREAARKSISLPIWMWKQIQAAQEHSGTKTESEIVRQIGAAILTGQRTLWDYLGMLKFKKLADGSLRAVTPDGFIIRISPESGGRWSSAAWHESKTDFNIPWPQWQHSIMAAQLAALSALDALRRDSSEFYASVVCEWFREKGSPSL